MNNILIDPTNYVYQIDEAPQPRSGNRLSDEEFLAQEAELAAQAQTAAQASPAASAPRAITVEILRSSCGRPPLAEAVPGERFTFTRADGFGGVSEALDFVEGLLTDGGCSVLFGPSNCGKSFWAVDLGAAVASGRSFRDELEVDRGAVVYIALEGSHGAKNRMAALLKTGLLKPTDPFFLIFDSVSLLDPGHSEKLSSTIAAVAAEAGVVVRLVILDTLARAMAGGDENSGTDMGIAVGAIDAVRAATGAHVMMIHHSGKDAAKGARGHSSLRAAVDTEIEVFRPEGASISTVRVVKQRDLPMGEPMPFSLKVVELGIDRRGKPITSCVVRHEASVMAASQGKRIGRPSNGATVEQLISLLPQASTSAWQRAARTDFDVTQTTFFRLLSAVRLQKLASHSKKGGWVLESQSFGSEFA